MSKWVMDPETKKPVRVSNEEAVIIVGKGGRWLGKYEAARILAAMEKKEGAHEKGTIHPRGADGHRAR